MNVVPIDILLVEDSPSDVLLTREALRDARIANDLSVARDGEDAMAYLRQEGEHADKPRPDIVILDLNLPRKDGREVLREIKRDDSLRRIPVVVLTHVVERPGRRRLLRQPRELLPDEADRLRGVHRRRALDGALLDLRRPPAPELRS